MLTPAVRPVVSGEFDRNVPGNLSERSVVRNGPEGNLIIHDMKMTSGSIQGRHLSKTLRLRRLNRRHLLVFQRPIIPARSGFSPLGLLGPPSTIQLANGSGAFRWERSGSSRSKTWSCSRRIHCSLGDDGDFLHHQNLPNSI